MLVVSCPGGLDRGIHERFFHATVRDLVNMLKRSGLPPQVLALCKPVVATCAECRAYERPPTKPTLRAELAGFFNDLVQVRAKYRGLGYFEMSFSAAKSPKDQNRSKMEPTY